MIFFLFFWFCVGYILKIVIEKHHPNFFVDFQTEISDKTLEFRLKLAEFLWLAGFTWEIGGFPLFLPARAEPQVLNTNTLYATTANAQQSNATQLETTIGLNSVRSRKTTRANLAKTPRKTMDAITESEKALILDDVVLDTLLCTNCEKYLSVLPIKIYIADAVKCGRCCKENDGGTISYLYENIANSCLFKCVNRYEQCTKLLTVSEVVQHERECVGGDYRCPKCEGDHLFFGTGYELLRHYKNTHSSSILTTNKFFIDLKDVPNKERYLYVKNDIIFFVLVELLHGEHLGKSLYLSVISLTPHKNIKQQFDLKFLGEPVKRMQTETKVCCSLETFKCDYFKVQIHSDFERIKCEANIDVPQDANMALEIPRLFKKPEKIPVSAVRTQTVPTGEITTVELTDQFIMEYPEYRLTPCGTALFKGDGSRIELTCSVCLCFTGSNVFSCGNGKHILCWECRTECKCDISSASSWNATVSTINEQLLLPCRQKCGQKFPGDGLRNHEASCIPTGLYSSYRRRGNSRGNIRSTFTRMSGGRYRS